MARSGFLSSLQNSNLSDGTVLCRLHPPVIDLRHEVALLVHIQLAGRKELVEHRALLEVFVARRLPSG